MTNMQDGDQENVMRHCNRHKSLTSVYFSKLFSKKEDSNHDKQFGKLNLLVSNFLQSKKYKISRHFNIEILYDF